MAKAETEKKTYAGHGRTCVTFPLRYDYTQAILFN